MAGPVIEPNEFTVINFVATQPDDVVNEIVADNPPALPVTIPVLPTEAIDGALLLHAPVNEGESSNAIICPAHTVDGPVIVELLLTAIMKVVAHPVPPNT